MSLMKNNLKNQNESYLLGFPILIEKGKISKSIMINKNPFYILPQARIAIGIKENGDLIIIVAEHLCKNFLYKMTLKEMRSVIKKILFIYCLNIKKGLLILQ